MDVSQTLNIISPELRADFNTGFPVRYHGLGFGRG